MALHAVLGVLSEAIRFDASPDEVAAMIAAAPGLSEAERDDLRRIPRERLAPYQHDIYMAERNMLVWGFANTWACLQRMAFGDAQGTSDDPERDFVIRFKRDYPCATHSVREMGTHFVACLARVQAERFVQFPWLLELAEAERLEIEVLYALDSPLGRPLNGPALAAFFSQPLGDVLAARIVRAESVHLGPYRHDITAIKRAIGHAGEDGPLDFAQAPFTPAAVPLHFGIARDHDTLEPTWYVADAADVAFVAATREQEPQTVESHAEAVLHKLAPADAPEDAQLALYLHRLERALRLRYLLVA